MSTVYLEKYVIEEQKRFLGERLVELKKLQLDFERGENEVRYLGLCPFNYSVSYYIGIDWLEENKSYLTVEPKIKHLDYIGMFMHCLRHPELNKYINEIYHIDFSGTPITLDTDKWEVTPMLIIHFLVLLKRVTQRGLKKNYITKEENLQGKIKGKISFSNHLNKNVFNKREDRIYCNYSDYSIDCPENRLLKLALLCICRNVYLTRIQDKYPELMLASKINKLLAFFEHVSDEVTIDDIRGIKLNPIYKEYNEAIKVAKLVIKQLGYSFYSKDDLKTNKLPPFWINMSKLYELYVYSKLKEGYPQHNISFQVSGKYGFVDFLDRKRKIIIDAKYKLLYADDKNKHDYDINDIRQLSGYARDIGVLGKFGYKSQEEQDRVVVDCVIIVPDKKSPSNFINRELININNKINQFTKFYWAGIRLPAIERLLNNL